MKNLEQSQKETMQCFLRNSNLSTTGKKKWNIFLFCSSVR